jgi:hypothetical protein
MDSASTRTQRLMKMVPDETICVLSERPVAQRQRYELSVYRTESD